MEEQLIEVAMGIILHAGNARNDIKDATEAILAGDMAKADELLSSAKENIRQSHLMQTQIIQAEARGTQHNLSLLFIHAQDTLMTIISEYNITMQFIKMYNNLDLRIKKLEVKND